MLEPRKLHLFNCDRTYKLDAVQDLMNTTTAKSRFVNLEKHYFSLAEMSDMSTKIIPKLEMDMAFFVVHAHESRLSINEDNAGIGYAKIYRALQKAAGENVIIVIGGDDNYTNEDEEDQFVISRWAKRKISSQFREEFLDGRKGFIFSWNKKHRKIHEEALLHFFDSSKKGQKFEHQPTQRKLPAKPVTPPPVRSEKLVQPFDLHSSLRESSLRCWREQFFASSGTDIKAGKSNVPSVSVLRGEKRRDTSQLDTVRKPKLKDLVILDCGVSEESRRGVRRVFSDLRSVLGVSTDITVESCSPASAKSFLLSLNDLKFCVLLVDAKRVKDVYERLPQGKVDYEDLLRTATDKVVKKVILVICSPGALLSLKDEVIFTEKIEGIFRDTGKGIIVWMKNGSCEVEPDVLADMIVAPGSPFESTSKPRTSYQDDFSRPRRTTHCADPDEAERQKQSGRGNSRFPQPEMCYGPDTRCKDRALQQSQGFVSSQRNLPPAHTSFTANFNSNGDLVLLKTRLRQGKISYEAEDIDILYPGYIVPNDIERSLIEKYMHTSEAVVEIVEDPKNKKERWSVVLKSKGWFSEESKEAHTYETVMLETRVRYGEVSMKENDLKFIFPEWYVPQYLIESLKCKCHATPDAKLVVISDVERNLRFIVETDVIDKALNFFKKQGKKLKGYKW